jgi:hypothetical protein
MDLPPEEEDCLFRLRSSTQKGGTLICEEVTDLAEHEKRIYSRDGYRPKPCRCGRRFQARLPRAGAAHGVRQAAPDHDRAIQV